MFAMFIIGGLGIKVKAEDHKIPIAMATDNNYVYPTVVAMTSMLENKKADTFLEFHIMISGQVSDENRNRMKKLQSMYNNCSVNLIDMKNSFDDTYIVSDYITKATYYRLRLPSVLKQYDKILYLDGDIIVREDLWDMFSIDLGDNYIGAVKDFGQMTWGSDYAQRLGVKDLSQLINAGILIMNLGKMRQDNLEKTFSEYVPTLESRRLYLNDQDVLSATCYNRIKFIHPKYNAMQHFGFHYDVLPILIDCYDMQEYKTACINPTIIHYTSINKPWKSSNCRFYGEWDKYRKKAESLVYGYQVIPNGVYTISSAMDGSKVLDIEGASEENGANCILWENHNSDNEKFKITYVGEGCYEIESCCSGKLLDVEGSGKEIGTNVSQFQKKPYYNDNQKWIIKHASNGRYYIISKCNGLYLDVCGAETENGTNIHVWKPNGGDNQKFIISK